MKRSKTLRATNLPEWLHRHLAGPLGFGPSDCQLCRLGSRFLVALVVLLLAYPLSACANRSDAWRRIEDTGVLVFGLDPTYPPFEMAVDDHLSGLDVDLARKIGEDLGLESHFVHFGYDGLYDALFTSQVDALISALVILPERTRDFAYSDPYFNAGQIMVTPADRPVANIKGLTGKRLAVELGAQGHVLASTWQRQLAQIEVLTLGTADEAMSAVSTGQADAAVVDAVSGRLHLARSPDLFWNGEYLTDEPYALVVRAEDQQLLDHLNQSLRRLDRSGELDSLVGLWLSDS